MLKQVLMCVSLPLRGRLIATLPALVVTTGAVVPGISFGADTEVQRMGIGFLAATIVALTIAIPLIDLLSDSVVSPITELVRATKRVRDGDLETRVSVFSTDETGNLARSFNEMVAAALASQLRTLRGRPLTLDASEVQKVGGLSLQVLLSAKTNARRLLSLNCRLRMKEKRINPSPMTLTMSMIRVAEEILLSVC